MAQRLRIQRCSWNGNGYLVLVFDNFMFSFRDFCHKIAVFFIHFKLSQIIVDKWRIKNFVFFFSSFGNRTERSTSTIKLK